MEPILLLLRRIGADAAGCVTTSRLLSAGVTAPRIRRLTQRGALTPVVRDVFLVTADTLSDRQLLYAAALAGGPGALVTARANAEYRTLLPPSRTPVDVIAPRSRTHRRLVTACVHERTGSSAVIMVRRSRVVERPDVRANAPLASVGRALVDLAAREGGHAAWRCWREADFKRLLDPRDIERVCGRGRPGSRIVRDLAESLPIVHTAETQAQTLAESLLIEQLLVLGAPRPASNQPLCVDGTWYYPDLWFRRWRAVIEVDGPVHRDPRRQRDDRLRDQHMRLRGIAVWRVERDVVLADPSATAADVWAWLSQLPVAHHD